MNGRYVSFTPAGLGVPLEASAQLLLSARDVALFHEREVSRGLGRLRHLLRDLPAHAGERDALFQRGMRCARRSGDADGLTSHLRSRAGLRCRRQSSSTSWAPSRLRTPRVREHIVLGDAPLRSRRRNALQIDLELARHLAGRWSRQGLVLEVGRLARARRRAGRRGPSRRSHARACGTPSPAGSRGCRPPRLPQALRSWSPETTPLVAACPWPFPFAWAAFD